MVMAAGDHYGCGLDHYQLLGVPREASRQEIAQAWRRRARDEHPDARPCDAGAPGRFRVLAEAWQVLGDPDRRAAYDRALTRGPQSASPVRITVRRHTGSDGLGGIAPQVPEPEPPLRAGPVWVDAVQAMPVRDEREFTLALLANLAIRYLARHRSQPW
jgi:curved DNA-binding protein CbpA